jgi:hypothetical protein
VLTTQRTRVFSTKGTHQLIVFREIVARQMQCFIRLVWREGGYQIVTSMVFVTAQGPDSFLQHDTASPPLLTSSLYHSSRGNKACEYPVAGLHIPASKQNIRTGKTSHCGLHATRSEYAILLLCCPIPLVEFQQNPLRKQ